VFASHAGDHMFPALRMFSSGVLANIMGILPEDGPIEKNARMGYLIKNWGKISNAGAFMTELFLTHDPFVEPDPTARPTISVGELDLFEWFLTNYPRPTLAPQTAETRRGRKLMDQMQCTSCHVADWEILPQDEEMGLPGDRRFFDLAVAHDPIDQRYEGTLVRLSETKTLADGTQVEVPKRGGFVVRDVFTDLQHHDLGPKFRHYTYRNERVSYASQFFRTPPLWGVAATPPYGHDGRSLTLDDVIRRHGGEAEESTQAYVTAPVEDREAVLAFLRTLQLYIPETLPTDLDGDGKISDHYMVAGRDLGPEVFRAELLFANSPIYRGWVGEGDARFYSYEMLNVAEAYGTNLKALRDSDGDTLPDLLEKDAPKVGFVPQRSSNATTSGPSLPAAAAAHDTP
ncbi:MAG: di-heme oxidoredictase family protein, partial [Acidobacteriota bacterium]